MSDCPPRIQITDEVMQDPRFGLVSLSVAIQRWPDKYRQFPREYLKLLHVGSYVKVLATSIGNVSTQEEIWLFIRAMSPAKTLVKHIGEIRTHTGRSKHHGLQFGMMIYFQLTDVIDVQLNRAETS